MYKFNNDKVITGYIKQLLHSFNLPKCKVFKSEQDLINYYPEKASCFALIRKYKDNNDCFVRLDDGNVTFKSYYIYGNAYQNLTTNMSLFNSIYDSSCHKYLGEYLRFLRDYKDLNLMGLYNCFANEILVGKDYKYIVVPVKHNTDYTIAFDGSSYDYVLTYNNTLEDIEDIFTNINNPEHNSIVSKSSKFEKPFVLKTSIGPNKVIETGPRAGNTIYSCFKESQYKLVIRVKVRANDIINVLEGDYTKNNTHFTPVQANYDTELDDKNYDNVDLTPYISNFQLLQDKKGVNCPFADRLLEYLTDMVILPGDTISNNVIESKYKVLERYGKTPRKKLPVLNDSFPNIYRLRFLDAFSQTKYESKNSYDLLGYVDKEIEQCLDDETRIPKE